MLFLVSVSSQLLSLTLDGLTGVSQDHMRAHYQTGSNHMMLNVNLWSTLFLGAGKGHPAKPRPPHPETPQGKTQCVLLHKKGLERFLQVAFCSGCVFAHETWLLGAALVVHPGDAAQGQQLRALLPAEQQTASVGLSAAIKEQHC